MTRRLSQLALSIALVGLVLPAGRVFAQSAADFYRGKTVSLVISTGTGGGYDTYGRALARHFGHHLAGGPNVIVKNMPGGGGLRAMNHLYAAAPKDGTEIGFVHSSVPMAPLLGMEGGTFDATKFNWIGSMNKEGSICIAWHDSPIKSFDDALAQEFIVGGTGDGSQMETYPMMLTRLFGARIKIISGYKGGNDVHLAMERGEVHGRCGHSMTSIRSTRPEWLTQNKIRIIVQTSLEADPELKDVPFIMDRAKTDEERAVMELIFANQLMDRPFLAPPGLPAERVAALRTGFKATLEDPAFLAEADKLKLAIRYVSGEEVDALIKRLYAAPPTVAKAAAEAIRLQ